MAHTVDFFDRQFRGQITAGEFALNPFEQATLPFLRGDFLDLGCGLGNLALAAARQGCHVTALDGSAAAVERLTQAAAAERLDVVARQADLGRDEIVGDFDAVVAIGLLMFFPRPRASAMLAAIQRATRPGGIAAINVLVEGTNCLDMFEPGHYTLFGRDELVQSFAQAAGAWDIQLDRHDGFDAPGGTRKEFATVIARRTAP